MAASLLVPLLLAIVPSVSTTSLAGNKIELPRDLHGPVSFLILAARGISNSFSGSGA